MFLAFTPHLREYSPRRFVTEILLGGLGMSELVIGYDHGFGRGRSGDVNTLRDIGAECGFAVDVVEAVHSGPAAISSSSIRRALAEGRLADANRGLGRPYPLTGTVVPGDGRGRELGFPTANLRVDDQDKLVPAEGIYACHATVPAGRFMGALHIGPRPTFPGAGTAVEVFLLDFEGELYGCDIRLELVERLRPVAAFASASELVETDAAGRASGEGGVDGRGVTCESRPDRGMANQVTTAVYKMSTGVYCASPQQPGVRVTLKRKCGPPGDHRSQGRGS